MTRIPSAPANSARAKKAYVNGTHRVRHPEHTWQIICPKLDRFGITRLADVTGLDTIGIPVVMAVRPLAKTLSVSQGKGQNMTLAMVSAAMESMELWHAEHAVPAAAHRSIAARELDLPYDLPALVTVPGGLVTEHTPMDWVDAVGVISGGTTPLPVALVQLTSPDEQAWCPLGIRSGSNGLASGNSLEEAALHALYEIIERDAISREQKESRRYIDPATVDDDSCADLVDRIISAHATVEIWALPSRFGVPCFGAQVWSPDFPAPCMGWGAHLAAEVALSRALTEAVQSRLAAIAGSRDDLPPIYHHVRVATGSPARPPESRACWPEVVAAQGSEFTDIAEELTSVSDTVTKVVGVEPLLVDLSSEDDLAAVRVVVPGSELDLSRVHPGEPIPTGTADRQSS